MPGLDGVNAIYQIRAADPNARIIVLTTYDGDEHIYRGMRAGAKSYLLKDVRREELFQCIRPWLQVLRHPSSKFWPWQSQEAITLSSRRRPNRG